MATEPCQSYAQTQSPVPEKMDTDFINGNSVEIEGNYYTTVKEGLATILVPKTQKNADDQAKKGAVQNVFYNPIQQFNRDLSVLAIKTYGEDAMKRKAAKYTAWSKTQSKSRPQGAEQDTKKRKRGQNDSAKGPISGADVSTGHAAGKEAEIRQSAEDFKNSKDTSDDLSKSTTTQINHTPANSPQFSILDALSATGLRALRYAHEIPFATRIVANDLSPEAAKSIQKNIVFNNLVGKIKAHQSNAIVHMYGFLGSKGSQKYDVIDLDPYGTAAPFLDAAIQAVSDGGLLCVTCTDAGVFASVGYPEKTYALYGGIPLKGSHCHEAGLRLILHAISTSAARYGRAIEPLLSLSIDFYARVFVRVRTSPAEVKMLAGKSMIVYNCDQGCGAWTIQPISRHRLAQDKKGGEFYKFGASQAPQCSELCKHCGRKTHLAGPMFGGPLHSASFVQSLLDSVRSAAESTYGTKKRMEGMLLTALEEALFTEGADGIPEQSQMLTSSTNAIKPNDPAAIDVYPFFFVPHALSRVLHCQTPPEAAIRGALKHAGYRVARSHTKAGSLKTDAPWSVIWTIMRAWVHQRSPIREGALANSTAGWSIMQDGAQNGKADHDSSAPASGPISGEDIIGSKTDVIVKKGVKGEGETKANEEEKPHGDREEDELEEKDVVFDEKLGDPGSTKGKLVRYQINPRANWGPMNRAKAE